MYSIRLYVSFWWDGLLCWTVFQTSICLVSFQTFQVLKEFYNNANKDITLGRSNINVDHIVFCPTVLMWRALLWSLFLSAHLYLSGIQQCLWHRGRSLVREMKYMHSRGIFKGEGEGGDCEVMCIFMGLSKYLVNFTEM